MMHSPSQFMVASNSPSDTRSRRDRSTPPSYGYHNTFHTHETPVVTTPPSYAVANSPQTLARLRARAQDEAAAVRSTLAPPAYSCTVEAEGVLGMKQELNSVFEVARHREWNDVYVVLRGTQLSIHRVKTPSILSKNRTPTRGRLIKTFSLQHSEVGIAGDYKKSALIPKSPFAHLVPASARQKLYETDPHLFEPVRENVFRLRLETEQFLLSASSPLSLLDWVETLCASIDISLPLEDRSEPRYRSLPRRGRRQRVLDGSRISQNLENLASLEGGRRIIEEQEQILRQLYPHLANVDSPGSQEPDHAPQAADPDRDEFDPDDVRFPTRQHTSSSMGPTESGEDEPNAEEWSSTAANDSDPKHAPIARPSRSQALRYRRRCAPVLLANSPRVSDVVFSGGRRLRINTKEHTLIEYTSLPPRYDAHNFPKPRRSASPKGNNSPRSATYTIPTPISVDRPAAPLRAVSGDSFTFGYELASTSSDPGTEEIRSAAPSEPPSPTALTHAKADASRQLVAMGKGRSSEENRENRLSAVTLGVGLLI